MTNSPGLEYKLSNGENGILISNQIQLIRRRYSCTPLESNFELA